VSTQETQRRRAGALGWMVFFGCALGVVILGLLATTINQRRAERTAGQRPQMVHPIDQFEGRNDVWGASFPRQFESWERTRLSEEKTRHGGSAFKDYLAERPNLVIMWAGFPFAKGFNQGRGHFNAVQDVWDSARIGEASPATCWTCKSPDVPRLMEQHGIEGFYAKKLHDFKHEINNSIGCADCHDNETMALTISRPALKEAFARMGRDISKATHQEMRSLVCAQCHVEYYFEKDTNYLTFPWDKGLTAEAMQEYYSASNAHRDWTHAISGARMIKMQHPDFEIYSQGIHAFRGVSCADCHMPYKTEGGIKFSDHQVRSPLLNIANSCQVCHRWSEDEIRERVYSIQDKTLELMLIAEQNITLAHLEIGDAMKRGATDEELTEVRDLVSRAQMNWDYIASGNGMGFHAPQESSRVLGKANNLAQECRVLIQRIRARYGALGPLEMPDISSKQKAQEFIQQYLGPKQAFQVAAPVLQERKANGGARR
jgi:nitrite reductase (cytochrome c-552)